MGDICVSNAMQVSNEMDDVKSAWSNIVLFTWLLAFMALIIFALLDVLFVHPYQPISVNSSNGILYMRPQVTSIF